MVCYVEASRVVSGILKVDHLSHPEGSHVEMGRETNCERGHRKKSTYHQQQMKDIYKEGFLCRHFSLSIMFDLEPRRAPCSIRVACEEPFVWLFSTLRHSREKKLHMRVSDSTGERRFEGDNEGRRPCSISAASVMHHLQRPTGLSTMIARKGKVLLTMVVPLLKIKQSRVSP